MFPCPRFLSAKNSIRDARTPQPGEIVFNTMRYIEVVKQYKDRDLSEQCQLQKGPNDVYVEKITSK